MGASPSSPSRIPVTIPARPSCTVAGMGGLARALTRDGIPEHRRHPSTCFHAFHTFENPSRKHKPQNPMCIKHYEKEKRKRGSISPNRTQLKGISTRQTIPNHRIRCPNQQCAIPRNALQSPPPLPIHITSPVLGTFPQGPASVIHGLFAGFCDSLWPDSVVNQRSS